MKRKSISISVQFSISMVLVVFVMIAISLITTGIFFQKNSLENFYESADTALSEFSDSITMFFRAKEVELNVFAESDEVKKADSSIHSFANEQGTIQILSYRKSPVENFASLLQKTILILPKFTLERSGVVMLLTLTVQCQAVTTQESVVGMRQRIQVTERL